MRDLGAPLGMEALAYQWPRTLLYAFPPVDLIQATVERVRQEGLLLILVALRWPRQLWFLEIIRLLGGDLWRVPCCWDLLSQVHGRVWHPRLQICDLWVWQ